MWRFEMRRFQLNFVCVGPQRTASSWLHRALQHHPDISLPRGVKETFFFDSKFGRGLPWYSKQFFRDGSEHPLGEVSPTYFDSEAACCRLREHFPDLRIIIGVRNPIARTYSLLLHEYTIGRVGADFQRVLTDHPRIAHSGKYGVHAPRWEAAFGSDRIMYLLQEAIERQPREVLRAVYDFIGVAADPVPEDFYGRFGQRTVPRFQRLAGTIATGASALRKAEFHGLVELGKRLGLRRVYQGGDVSKVMLEQPLFERLLELHSADIAFLESRLSMNFGQWRDYAATLEELRLR
jgi:Sulfotransferase domain